jgi:four helix bundle protein
MKIMEPFNDEFRKRTKQNALRIIRMYQSLISGDESKIIGKQLLRSSTSVAANFRASCRARSDAEHYSKLCIVIEECDETLFWLEMLEESGLVQSNILTDIKQETLAILCVMSITRKKLKGNPK